MILQLIVLLFVLSIIKSLFSFKNKTASIIVSFILALVFIVQLGSVIITGEIADYRFYENFNVKDIISVSDFFAFEAFLIIFALLLSTVVISYLGIQLRAKIHRKTVVFASLVVGIIVLSTYGGVINNVYTTARLKFSDNTSFSQSLAALNINLEEYVQ